MGGGGKGVRVINTITTLVAMEPSVKRCARIRKPVLKTLHRSRSLTKAKSELGPT